MSPPHPQKVCGSLQMFLHTPRQFIVQHRSHAIRTNHNNPIEHPQRGMADSRWVVPATCPRNPTGNPHVWLAAASGKFCPVVKSHGFNVPEECPRGSSLFAFYGGVVPGVRRNDD